MNWKTVLTSGGTDLGQVDIRRVIFQGDSLSPLLFVLIMLPLTLHVVLWKMRVGFRPAKDMNPINHLLFIDDLKLYEASKDQLDSIVQVKRFFSQDIGMSLGLDKWGPRNERGSQVGSSGIDLTDDRHTRELEEEGFKYLGTLQLDMTLNTKMKDRVTSEYVRRVKKLCRSKLNNNNNNSLFDPFVNGREYDQWHQCMGCECTTSQCRYYGLDSGSANQHGQKN